jgi:hypothetical protein
MWSKNKKPMTPAEREHVERIKLMPCMVCNAAGPSDAHEPRQGLWWCAIPLCRYCHTNLFGPTWRIRKWTDEWQALNETLRIVFEAIGSRFSL